MRRRTYILLVIGGITVVGICAYLIRPAIEAKLVAAHQASTTAELAKWGEEYSTIRDANDAGRALEMLEYIQHYYVVAPGYRSDPETEERLEDQRDSTMRRISVAFDQSVEREGGRNAEVWRAAKSKALAKTRWRELDRTESW
jgi:hypothetical protein